VPFLFIRHPASFPAASFFRQNRAKNAAPLTTPVFSARIASRCGLRFVSFVFPKASHFAFLRSVAGAPGGNALGWHGWRVSLPCAFAGGILPPASSCGTSMSPLASAYPMRHRAKIANDHPVVASLSWFKTKSGCFRIRRSSARGLIQPTRKKKRPLCGWPRKGVTYTPVQVLFSHQAYPTLNACKSVDVLRLNQCHLTPVPFDAHIHSLSPLG